jgi:hypothetical protein
MEEQQSYPDNSSTLFQLNLDISNSYILRSAGSWAKVTGVVGMLAGIMIIAIAIVAINLPPPTYSSRSEGIEDVLSNERGAAAAGAVIMIIAGLIFVIGAIFSYSFGSRIMAALKANDQNGIERGFASLRNYFALRGIILIIVSLLLLITLVGAL